MLSNSEKGIHFTYFDIFYFFNCDKNKNMYIIFFRPIADCAKTNKQTKQKLDHEIKVKSFHCKGNV